MEYAHKAKELKIGQTYLVAHAKWRWRLFPQQNFYVPIIPHLHADPQFSPHPEHYHFDARFKIDKYNEKQFRLKDGRTDLVFWPNWEEKMDYILIEIVYKKKKCVRLDIGLENPHKHIIYDNWYNTMLGKSCKGRRCPHYGTIMQEINGKLVCPMHNLTGDIKTETIIPII